MKLYLDTSALVKLFVVEEYSDLVSDAVRKAVELCTSRLAWAESVTAFARLKRERRINESDFFRLVESLDRRWPDIRIVEVTATLLMSLPILVLSHPLRTGDAIHLASAKAYTAITGDVRCAVFDDVLAKAMRECGLEVLGAG